MFENEVMYAASGGNFVLAPVGNHFARLCSIVEIGTVDGEFVNDKGQTIKNHERRIQLGFELLGTEHIFDAEKGPEPFVIHKEYTNKISKKSGLGKDLKSWLNKELTPEEVKSFNLVLLLGKTEGMGAKAMINVTHGKTDKGNDKAEVSGITPVSKNPDGTEVNVPAGKVKQKLFNFNLPFKKDTFNGLPKFIQDKIRTSDEYKKILGEHTVPPTTGTPVQQVAGAIADPGDDLPF